MSSDENGNTGDMSNAIKQFMPSLILFIIGIVVGFILIGNNGDAGLGQRIVLGLLSGWILGGTVLGWIKTRTLFNKPNVQQNTYTSPTGIMDHNAFFKAARLPIRIICAEVVGIFLMPVEFIKFIIAIFRSKKYSSTTSNNSTYNSNNTSSGINNNSPINVYKGETWICKKCNEENPITSASCKSCGEYK